MFIGLYLPIHYFGSIGGMFHQVQEAKPGFAALKGDQLSPVWFSSTVLLTALGFYMWPHTFGSALTARNEDVFRRNAIFMPLYQLLIAFVLLVGFVAVLRLPGLGEDRDRPRAARHLPAGVPGLVRRADRLGRDALRAGPGVDAADRVGDDRRAQRLPRAEPVDVRRDRDAHDEAARAGHRASAPSRSCSQGGQTIVTLLLLGYALVTQLFPALLCSRSCGPDG